MKTLIGIDPGKDGAIAILDIPEPGVDEPRLIKTNFVACKDFIYGKEYDVGLMADIVKKYLSDLVVIEKQKAYPLQGRTSQFSIGYGYGLWEGLVAALKYPYIVVTPQTWQKKIYAGIAGDDPKKKSIIAAGRLFPDVDLRRTDRCKIKHHGMSDALLLAWYGYLYIMGSSSGD